MNRQQLRDLLKRELGTPLPAVVYNSDANTENTNLNNYLDDARAEMDEILGGHESSDTITLANGTRLYAKPANFRSEEDVRYVRSASEEISLTRIASRSELPIDYRSATGEPVYYYFEANQFGFYPIPGSDQNTKSVRVNGWFNSTSMDTDNESPEWESRFHRPLALLAAAKILEAQAVAEAQSSNTTISADVVNQESRTRNYSARAKEMRERFESLLYQVRGLVI